MSEKNIETIIKDQNKEPEGLQFPCEHPVKAMGPNTEKFKQEVLFLVQNHCPEVTEKNLRSNQSKTGKYQSVTVELTATSREHLEAIYKTLKDHKDVKWTL